MKQWIAIFILLFTAAMTDAGSTQDSLSHILRLNCATLSQSDTQTIQTAETPLFATTTPAGTLQLCGAKYSSIRSRHLIDYHTIYNKNIGSEVLFHLPRSRNTSPHITTAYARAVDYYIYALRQIII
ncbi:MAG: hypothetical protein RRY23_06885 [Alistipes sp.]